MPAGTGEQRHLRRFTILYIKKQSVHYRILRSYKDTLHGPSDRIRTCGILLPKQARYQLRYTRLLSYFIRLVVFSQIKRDTNFAIPGYFFSIPQLRVEGKRKFLVYINKVVIGGRLPADDDLIQICIKHLACCALRQREGDIRAEKVGVDGQVEAAALQLHQAAGDG